MRTLKFYDTNNIELMARMLEASVAAIEKDLLSGNFPWPAASTHAYITDNEQPYLSKLVVFVVPRI